MPPLKSKVKDSRSRNGTPILGEVSDQSNGSVPVSSTAPSVPVSYSDLLEKFCRGSSPPPSATLKKIHEALLICRNVAKDRSDRCDKSMRELSRKRTELFELAHQQELEEARAEEARKEDLRKAQMSESRPLAVGAHSVARQDGSAAAEDDTPEISPKPEPESIASPTRSAFSEEERQPRPAPAKPQIQTFGEDPTTFDDPTTYHIREIHENLTEEEKKEIFGVKEYPHDDLHKQTPGTPPDRDFSNAKPSNQVSFAQFSNYVEPYIRPLAVEDISVLDERGDRSSPFVIPRRGGKHYQQIWDEEDSIAAPSSSNRSHIPQPSGSMDQMNDEAAEKGTISVGPVMARLTSAMIPERRAPTAETSVNGVNGDSGNNASTNGEAEGSIDANGEAPGARPLAPATHMPESNQPGWKANPPKMDYGSLDQRALQELRHIGFIEEEAQPDYDEHYDDEIAARLRYLQGELRLMSLVNGARKRRVKELALEALAKQEYNTIADDLDNQINQSYLKRHRNYGKNKKVSKRPGATTGGQVGGSGVSKASLGEQIKSLLDRRQEWKRVVGPIVEYGSLGLPEDTIFDKASMTKHFAAELELWVEQTGEQA